MLWFRLWCLHTQQTGLLCFPRTATWKRTFSAFMPVFPHHSWQYGRPIVPLLPSLVSMVADASKGPHCCLCRTERSWYVSVIARCQGGKFHDKLAAWFYMSVLCATAQPNPPPPLYTHPQPPCTNVSCWSDDSTRKVKGCLFFILDAFGLSLTFLSNVFVFWCSEGEKKDKPRHFSLLQQSRRCQCNHVLIHHVASEPDTITG